MTRPESLNRRKIAVYLVGAQAIVATTIPLLVWIAVGKSAAGAAFVGGWIATLANGYFALQAFRFSGARASRDMVRAMYRGEAGKFVIVMVMFIATFSLLPGVRDNATYLFSAFFLVYGTTWVAPVFLQRVR